MGLLENRVAIVTGSGRGIGKAMVELFTQEGAKVIVNDVDADVAEQTAQELKNKGAEAEAVVGSVTEVGDCERICKTAVEKFGKLDVLVNNAGTTRDKTIHHMTDELWHFIVDIVLKGAFNMIRAAAPYMREAAKQEKAQGKEVPCRKIINISSIAGIRGNAGQANYASAKAGIIGLTKTIAREWGGFNICTNCIAPGFIETRLTAPKESPDSPIGLPPGTAEMTKMMIPLQRTGKPIDVAKVALFLASSLSDYVNGQCLIVDGGLT